MVFSTEKAKQFRFSFLSALTSSAERLGKSFYQKPVYLMLCFITYATLRFRIISAIAFFRLSIEMKRTGKNKCSKNFEKMQQSIFRSILTFTHDTKELSKKFNCSVRVLS
jgi:hypothetical protein